MKALQSFVMTVTICLSTWCDIPVDFNILQQNMNLTVSV